MVGFIISPFLIFLNIEFLKHCSTLLFVSLAIKVTVTTDFPCRIRPTSFGWHCSTKIHHPTLAGALAFRLITYLHTCSRSAYILIHCSATFPDVHILTRVAWLWSNYKPCPICFDCSFLITRSWQIYLSASLLDNLCHDSRKTSSLKASSKILICWSIFKPCLCKLLLSLCTCSSPSAHVNGCACLHVRLYVVYRTDRWAFELNDILARSPFYGLLNGEKEKSHLCRFIWPFAG